LIVIANRGVQRGSEMHDNTNHVFIIMDGEADEAEGMKLDEPPRRNAATGSTMTHPKIQVVERARRARAHLPECTPGNRELGPVLVDEAVTGFADPKSLADKINIILDEETVARLR
jgi:hypothetical protein